MASVTAAIRVESDFDKLIEAGWDLSVHADVGKAVIRLRHGQQLIHMEGRTIVEAYMRLIKAEQDTHDGVSTEGAAWAADEVEARS